MFRVILYEKDNRMNRVAPQGPALDPPRSDCHRSVVVSFHFQSNMTAAGGFLFLFQTVDRYRAFSFS